MALSVGFLVEAEWLLAVGLVGNDGLGASIFQPLSQRCAVISLVAEKLGGGFDATDQALGRWAIVRLGAAILLASGYLAIRIAAAASADPLAPIASAVLVLACFPMVFWTLRGMEVGLVGVFLLFATLLVMGAARHDNAWTLVGVSTLAGLAFLTRPDAIILFTPHVMLLVAPNLRSLHHLLALLPAALLIAAQVLFRWTYYGDLVPNTYTLKMTGVSQVVRLLHGAGSLAAASTFPVVATTICAFTLWVRRDRSSLCRLALTEYRPTALHLWTYPVSVDS